MSEALEQWDTVVIGGGLAGSAAATRLTQHGRKVLLLEKEPAAHDKVCGEFISVEAQHYFNKLGVDLTGLGAKPITHIRLMRGNKVIETPLPFSGISLSRRKLDDTMLLHAARNGAETRRGILVSGLTREHSRWRIELPGSSFVSADTVFLATGKHDIRGWPRGEGIQNNFIGFKMHFELTSEQTKKLNDYIEMALFNGGYAGLEPVEGGRTNLCLVVTKSRFAECGRNWEQLLAAILREMPPFAERLADARACWPKPLAIFGIPYGFVHFSQADAPQKLYRLGDQMAVIPSFSGNGISIAMHTAFLAVENYLHGDADTYHRRARIELLPQVRRASWLSKIAEFPLAQKGILSICGRMPKLMATIAVGTRISTMSN